MSDQECIVGIDLGTTYSEVAAFVDDRVQILGSDEESGMLPSCVGLSPSGDLLIGRAARNQQILYPDRTVRSVKRLMGRDEKVVLGEQEFTPQEISALILRELAARASRALGRPVGKAVITVPAYFSDSQRQATREAGLLAGLEVVRILNEPTAASLAYRFEADRPHTAMVYDLGGGTFDVSLVTVEGEITEVLASHGNNRLGGDDFDDLLRERLAAHFEQLHGIDLRRDHPEAYARIWWAAEEAKKTLSYEPYVKVREESLVIDGATPLHLELEISRDEFEEMITPMIETTLESVSRAMQDGGKKPADLDAIYLVGGSTRIPLLGRLLRERAGIEPRQDVHPDLCVALGAGVLASRIAGRDIDRVLVDVSPYSFGPSYMGERGGFPYPHCYHPIIRRNTPLPVTRTERYYTSVPYQDAVEINIYQGDDDDALKNILVGHFRVDGLQAVEAHNEVLCRMSLDIDGILQVTATEKRTGKSKHITITDAMQEKSEEEIREARERLGALFSSRSDEEWPEDRDDASGEAPAETHDGGEPGGTGDARWIAMCARAEELVGRSRSRFEEMHPDDREEAVDLHEQVSNAVEADDREALSVALEALEEFLFFVEGK